MAKLFVVLAVWNATVFAIYGYDKWAARTGRRRIREVSLIAMAFGFGALGAIAAMRTFRHKTRKPAFTFLIPLALITSSVMTVLFVMR